MLKLLIIFCICAVIMYIAVDFLESFFKDDNSKIKELQDLDSLAEAVSEKTKEVKRELNKTKKSVNEIEKKLN